MDLEELINKYKNEDGSLTIPKELIPFIALKKEIEKGVYNQREKRERKKVNKGERVIQ